MRCIHRYTHHGATSWAVCIKRAGNKHERYFADGDDGPAASQERAVAWRDAMERRLTPWNKLHRRPSIVNTSGHVGLSVVDDRTRKGTRVRRYIAQWNRADGRKGKRSFSALLYGEAEAKSLALAARRAGVAELLASRAVR